MTTFLFFLLSLFAELGFDVGDECYHFVFLLFFSSIIIILGICKKSIKVIAEY